MYRHVCYAWICVHVYACVLVATNVVFLEANLCVNVYLCTYMYMYISGYRGECISVCACSYLHICPWPLAYVCLCAHVFALCGYIAVRVPASEPWAEASPEIWKLQLERAGDMCCDLSQDIQLLPGDMSLQNSWPRTRLPKQVVMWSFSLKILCVCCLWPGLPLFTDSLPIRMGMAQTSVMLPALSSSIKMFGFPLLHSP